jgi:Tol biopolymer transport system component
MTTFQRFEESIPRLMDDLAPARVPDYFDDLLQATANQRQRPAWTYPERWLPVDITARPVALRSIPLRPMLIVVIVTLAVVAGLVALAGSRPALPPPFGPAGNGLLVTAFPDHSIVTIDPVSGRTSVLAPASANRGEPIPSRDGRRIMFFQDVPGAAPIVVTDFDGSHPTVLAGEYVEPASFDWSPDDRHLAFTARSRGTVAISVAATDGSSATTLPLERDVRDLWYLPDGRLAIIAAAERGGRCDRDLGTGPSGCALFTVRTDGTGLDPIVPASAFDGLGVNPSPDGSKVLYVQWSAGADGRLRVVDLETREDRPVPISDPPARYSINHAWFSPDGTSILFDFFEVDGDHWAVIAASGGPIRRIGRTWTGEADAAWSPDGRSVIAWYKTDGGGDELWLLDPTGAGNDRRLPIDLPWLPMWQRVSFPAR